MREEYLQSLVRFSQSKKIKSLPAWERGLSRSDEVNSLVFEDPYAFVVGLIFDQGMRSDIAWTGPYRLKRRLGHLDSKRVVDMGIKQLAHIVARGESLHRFPTNTAKYIIKSSSIIIDEFQNAPELIWHGYKSITPVKENFLKLHGLGEKKANLAILLLARELKIKFEDIYLLGVALDSHIKRVLSRSGCFNVTTKSGIAEMNSRIRNVYPSFPSSLGTPLWYIGRHFCDMTHPRCKDCPVSKRCLKQL